MPAVFGFQVMWQMAFHLDWMKLKDEKINFLGYINGSTTNTASSALTNIILISFFNIITSFKNPSYMVTIRSKVEFVIITEEEASILKALNVNQIQAKHINFKEVLKRLFKK